MSVSIVRSRDALLISRISHRSLCFRHCRGRPTNDLDDVRVGEDKLTAVGDCERCCIIHADNALELGYLCPVIYLWLFQFLWDFVGFRQVYRRQVFAVEPF